jgi:hypothetical protein
MSEDCAICMQKKKLKIELSCSHSFCGFCIKFWAKTKKTCPLCRKPFADAELVSFQEWLSKQVTGHVCGDEIHCGNDFLHWERLRIFGSN